MKTICALTFLVWLAITGTATANQIYWTTGFGQTIERASLDGSDHETVSLTSNLAGQIALDPTEGQVYWTGVQGRGISRATTSGSGTELLAVPSGDPEGIALDLINEKMYWAESVATSRIMRANLDGSLPEVVVIVPSLGPNGVALDLDVSPDLPQVECDAEMIRSVIMDLMGNALDACSWRDYEEGESGRVVLGVHPGSQNGSVEIVVSDNGGGMTEEVRERIFTPFFSTKEKKGTGMGLAVVARIVSTHEGKTEVESEPGKGATFRVTLPTKGPSLREE